MNFRIGEVHPNTPHLLADLAELILCVNHMGRTYLHKSDLESLIGTSSISPEEIDEESHAEEEAEYRGESSAERSERNEKRIEDVFLQLRYRQSSMPNCYPFQVTGEEISINDEISEKQSVYQFLVACSRLRSFNRSGIPQKWAKHFTELCKIALQGLVPNHAEVRIFDANSDDRRTYYSTNLREALKKLGEDLGVLWINQDECNRENPSGDKGIDLVATVKFSDGSTTNFAILGQCGAQESEWPSKRLEASPIQLRNFFQFQFDYPNTMFIPLCYRNSDGGWGNNFNANAVLLIDRLRILYLIEKQNNWNEVVNSEWFKSFKDEFNEFMKRDNAIS